MRSYCDFLFRFFNKNSDKTTKTVAKNEESLRYNFLTVFCLIG